LKPTLNIGTDRALEKIKHFCGYQERNHREVKEKLFSFGLYKDQVETLISVLIQEDYLNEERYAMAFARGKFRMKGWGKIKIKYELKQQQISDYCIIKALQAIDEEDYIQTFTKAFDEKIKTLKSEKNIFIKKKKLQSFLMQRGFEAFLITEKLNTL
jgi:regulatory protein